MIVIRECLWFMAGRLSRREEWKGNVENFAIAEGITKRPEEDNKAINSELRKMHSGCDVHLHW